MTNTDFENGIQRAASHMILWFMEVGLVSESELIKVAGVRRPFLVDALNGKIKSPPVFWITVLRGVMPTSQMGLDAAVKVHMAPAIAVQNMVKEGKTTHQDIAKAMGLNVETVSSFVDGMGILQPETWHEFRVKVLDAKQQPKRDESTLGRIMDAFLDR